VHVDVVQPALVVDDATGRVVVQLDGPEAPRPYQLPTFERLVKNGFHFAHAWAQARIACPLHEEIKAHLYAINHIEFSPDSEHFVTCGLDKSVKVWHTASLTLLKVIDKARHAGHGTSVNRLLWSSFNKQLISASDDRSISVWNIHFEKQSL